jgi:hypothetical protein
MLERGDCVNKFGFSILLAGAIFIIPKAIYAANEGDTISTSNTRCSQTLGYCIVTTTEWQFIGGKWVLISFAEVQVALPPGMTPKDRLE